VHRRERRHRRRDYVLRAEFSARPTGVSHAVGLCLVPMDPVASVVGIHLMDFLSAYRCTRTEGRYQFGLIGRAFGRRGRGRCRVVAVEKRETE